MPRPRLHRLLEIAHRFPLTVVTAPAGYGKTTMLSTWMAELPGPASWISLDADDNDWSVFLVTLLGALRSMGVDAGSALLGPEGGAEELSAEGVADRLVAWLRSYPNDLTIVLDDAQVLESPPVHQFVRTLLANQPPCLHLILSSRSLPGFLDPVFLRPDRGIHIDVDDLRFTTDEATRFLGETVDTELDPTIQRAVIDIADGWIAGLQAAALQLLRLPAGSLPGRMAMGQAAMSVMGDVLDRLPPDRQQLLCRLSVPSRLCPALVRELTHEPVTDEAAEGLLQELVRDGLFLLPLGNDSAWYRFHPLFRELLENRLTQTMSRTDIDSLHLSAGDWFAGQGEIVEAIRHANVVGCPERILPDLVRASHTALAADRWFDVEHWLALIPPALFERDMEVMLLKTWVCQTRGRHIELRQRIQQARSMLAETAIPPRPERLTRIYEAELAVLTVMVDEGTLPFDAVLRISADAYATLRGSNRYAELLAMFGHLIYQGSESLSEALAGAAEEASKQRSADDSFGQLHRLWALSAWALLLGRDGDIHMLEHAARSVLDGARRAGAPRLEAQGAFYLGSVLYEQNRLPEAESHLRSVARNSAAGILVRTGAATRLAYCLSAQGNREAANRELESLLDWLIAIDASDILPALRTAQARLALMDGDLSRARSCMNAVPLELQRPRIRTPETPAVVAALVHTLVGSEESLQTAAELLDELERTPASLHWRSTSLQLQLVRALLQQATGQSGEAVVIAERVASEAERTGYLRSLLDLGPAASALMEHASSCYPASSALRRLVHTQPPPERKVGSPVPERGELLTEREMDVLRCLQGRWSDKEIASALSISPLTVKSHSRNIYAKLGVHGRRQAVRRAYSLGLLQDSDAGAVLITFPGGGYHPALPGMQR